MLREKREGGGRNVGVEKKKQQREGYVKEN
jgi:hypothetical protein